MNMMTNYQIQDKLMRLEELVNALISRTNNDKFYANAETAGVRKSVGAITPYTDTKTAYIGDTELVFYDAPESGNVTVFFNAYYNMERIGNKITLTFEPLTDITDITISIL